MRFWLWEKRQNHTCRPKRPLSLVEESLSVFRLRKSSNKTNNAELRLFLEIYTTDLKPIPLPEKTNSDILLFLKLYDPAKEELRYVSSLFVKASGKPSDILAQLKGIAGFAPIDEIELFEEIRFEPNVVCKKIDKSLTFRGSQLEDGGIICCQRVLSKEYKEEYQFPDVPSFLKFVHNRQIVRFRSLDRLKKDSLQAELNALQAQLALVTAERDEARRQGDGGLGQVLRDVAYYSGRAIYFQTLLMTHAPHVSIPPYSQVVSEDRLSGYYGTSKITISGSTNERREIEEGKSLRRPEGHGEFSAT